MADELKPRRQWKGEPRSDRGGSLFSCWGGGGGLLGNVFATRRRCYNGGRSNDLVTCGVSQMFGKGERFQEVGGGGGGDLMGPGHIKETKVYHQSRDKSWVLVWEGGLDKSHFAEKSPLEEGKVLANGSALPRRGAMKDSEKINEW